ncbi:MAG: threonine/serine dehydratase [Burkholderiaceae bacterium]
MDTINRKSIAATAHRINAYVRQTPVMQCELDGKPVELKLEALQISGTFKARGAFNRLLSNPESQQVGVAAASGGNHGIAVATAARSLQYPAHIFVPGVTPEAKRSKLRNLGARLTVVGEHYADAAAACQEFIQSTGALSCHAYDQVETLNGQGTVAMEWLAQSSGLDTMLVAVGGGGLIGGMSAWCQGETKLIAVESVGCPTLHEALAAGQPTDVTVGGLAADSLGARRVGELMFPLAKRYIETSLLVTDEQIRKAQQYAWANLNLLLEPGGAAALAALLSNVYRPEADERIGVLICGSNTRGPDEFEPD